MQIKALNAILQREREKERETKSKRDQARPREVASGGTKADQMKVETNKRRKAGGFVA